MNSLTRGILKRVAIAAVLALTMAEAARAQALVINGETIADAKTVGAAKDEGKLVLYGTYPADLMKSVLDAFHADTGIAPDFLRLTSQVLFPRVTSEFASHRLEADYVDFTDPTLVRELVEKGILDKPLKVPGFDSIPVPLRDAQGRWYTLIRPVGVIGVNNAVVQQADMPHRWADLLDPKWRGKIGMPSIETGGSAFVPFVFLQKVVAPDFWERLAAQHPRIYPAAMPTEQDLIRGETSLAIGTTSLITQTKAGAPVTVVFPEEGIPGFPITGGIVTSAPHPNAAALFLDWMASKRGAATIGRTGSYGINPNAPAPAPEHIAFPPVQKVWNLPPDEWEHIRQAEIAEWHKTFGK